MDCWSVCKAGHDPRDVLPRFCRVKLEVAPPPGLQGEMGRFAKAPAACRCVAPPRLLNRLRALRQASRSLGVLISMLREEIGAVLSRKGVNDGMLQVMEHACVCFDWPVLVASAPKEHH